MKLVNLIGFSLTVAGKLIPAGEYRAVAPNLNQSIQQGPVETCIEIDGVGSIPVVQPAPASFTGCVIERVVKDGSAPLPFPPAVDGTIYVVPYPVRVAARAAGRIDVYGMGDAVDPADRSKGVKSLAA